MAHVPIHPLPAHQHTWPGLPVGPFSSPLTPAPLPSSLCCCCRLDCFLTQASLERVLPCHTLQPDDWDVLEDEKENITRLQIRLQELQELAARSASSAAAAAAAPGGAAPGMATYSAAEQDELQMRIGEVAEALGKLQVIVQGPPTEFDPLVEGQHAQVRGRRSTRGSTSAAGPGAAQRAFLRPDCRTCFAICLLWYAHLQPQ